MLNKGDRLRRLCVFCVGMVVFGLSLILSLTVDVYAKEQFKLVKEWQGGQYNDFQGMCVGESGNVFVSERGSLKKFTSDGDLLFTVNSVTIVMYDNKVELSLYETSLAGVDGEENLYFWYSWYGKGNGFLKFDSSLEYITFISLDDAGYTNYVSTYIASDGSLYAISLAGTTGKEEYLTHYNDQGEALARWVCAQAGTAETALCVDRDGYVYVYCFSDNWKGREVRKYTSTGELVYTFDVDNNHHNWTPMTIDGSGNIYVQNYYLTWEPRLQKYTNDGTLLAETEVMAARLGFDMDGHLYAAINKYPDITIQKYALEEAGDFVVNTTSDESDANPGDGVCDVDLSKDGDQCTLRAAIEEVNLSKDTGTITVTFDIPVTDYGYSSNTGAVNYTIKPKKPLPDINKTVVIDAASQPNGAVVLDGKNAGKASGISARYVDCMVKGMNILNFSRDGITARYNIFLKNTKVSSNKGAGVSARRDITIEGTDNEFSDNGKSGINSGGAVNAYNAILQAEHNGEYGIVAKESIFVNGIGTGVVIVSGNGGKGDGGGVRSLKKSITVKNVEVTDNNGPGIVAKKDISLRKVKINNNHGPGIQSMSGNITIIGATDNSDANEVRENEGPGILTGTEMMIPALGDSTRYVNGMIDIQTHITVSKNTGWGIFGTSYVKVNRIDNSGVSPHASIISGNGDKTKKCYIVTDDGNLTVLRAKT